MATDFDEIVKKLGEESLNLGASNRKADTLSVFNGLLLIELIKEAQKANQTLLGILRAVRDD